MHIWLGERKCSSCCLGLEIITLESRSDHQAASKHLNTYSGVALLRFGRLSGEDDQPGLVGFQSLDIESLSLLAQVSPPVVNNYANAACLFTVDTCLLQLSQSKPTTLANLAVVANSLATYSRAEQCKGADTELCCLNFAGVASAQLAAGLIEPGAHATLPILVEVVVVEN